MRQEIRSAGPKGLGLFARVSITDDTYLFNYGGMATRDHEYSGSSMYAVGCRDAAGREYIIDGEDPNISTLGRYLNHASGSDPMCNCAANEMFPRASA